MVSGFPDLKRKAGRFGFRPFALETYFFKAEIGQRGELELYTSTMVGVPFESAFSLLIRTCAVSKSVLSIFIVLKEMLLPNRSKLGSKVEDFWQSSSPILKPPKNAMVATDHISSWSVLERVVAFNSAFKSVKICGVIGILVFLVPAFLSIWSLCF